VKTKDELIAVAQAAAETLHEAGCDLTIAIGWTHQLGITVSGCWAPAQDLIETLLESVLASMRSGEAQIRDLRKERG
jgi:hypothetical protein